MPQCNLDSDCKSCVNTAYFDASGKTNLNKDTAGAKKATKTTADAESCKAFCKTDYPTEAKYFSWVDGKQTKFGERYKNTCWCRTKDAISQGTRRTVEGTTTGITCSCLGKECQQDGDCCDGLTCNWAMVKGTGEAKGTLFLSHTKKVCLAKIGNACDTTMDCYGAENNTGNSITISPEGKCCRQTSPHEVECYLGVLGGVSA